MRPIPAPRIGDSHGLLRAIDERGRLRTDEFVTEFTIDQLFPPDLENALGRMRHFISYARAAGLVKEDRGIVELTEVGRRYVRAGDGAAPYDVSGQQAEWLRRQLREKHMTDSIYHGLAIGLSLLASCPADRRVSTLDFGRSLAYLGRAGWDNENTFAIQGERYVTLLGDLELIDGGQRLTATGEQVRGDLTLPVHMSLVDIAAQLNPGGAEAVRADAEAEWSGLVEAGGDEYEDAAGTPAPSATNGEAVLPTGPPASPAAAEAVPADVPAPPASVGPPVPPADVWETAAPDDSTRAIPSVRPPIVPRAFEPPADEPRAAQPAAVAPPASQPLEAEPPVAEPPVVEPPVAEPPVAEPPVAPSVVEPPVAEPPVAPWVAEPPVVEPPVVEPPVAAPPVAPRVAEPPSAAPPSFAPPPAAPPSVAPPAAEPPAAAPPPAQAPAAEPVAAVDTPTMISPAGAAPPPVSAPPAPATPHERPAAAEPDLRDAGGFLDPGAIRAAAEADGLRLPAALYAGVAAALGAGKHLLLVGPPGAGKTALALAVARAAAHGGRAQGATLVTARHRWDGEAMLVDSAKRGRWVIVDELDRARLDRALGALSSFLAGLPVLLPDGDEAEPDPAWRIVATAAAPPRGSAALLRRFAVIEVPPPPPDALRAAIDAAAGHDRTAVAAVQRLLALADLAPLGAGVFLDAARYAAARQAAAPADAATLAREAYNAYVAPLLPEGDDDARRRVRAALDGE